MCPERFIVPLAQGVLPSVIEMLLPLPLKLSKLSRISQLWGLSFRGAPDKRSQLCDQICPRAAISEIKGCWNIDFRNWLAGWLAVETRS